MFVCVLCTQGFLHLFMVRGISDSVSQFLHMVYLFYFIHINYRPRSFTYKALAKEGDNALGSVHLSVRMSVCALLLNFGAIDGLSHVR